MRLFWIVIASAMLTLAACQAQPGPAWMFAGQRGWMQGPYAGPMMGYGYCPGATNERRQGWYGPGMMGGHMMGGPMMGGRGFDASRTDEWLDAAKAGIGITTAQEQLWSAYADAVRADRASMASMHEQMRALMAPDLSGADRLDAHLAIMTARLESLRTVQAASRALYNGLSAEQRQQADHALWSGCW